MDADPTQHGRDTLDRAKSVLRLEARAARRAVSPEMREAAARAIAERVLALPEVHHSTAVMVYGASPEEADPAVLEAALRERGTRVAYPRIIDSRNMAPHWLDDRADLELGPFGLLQPGADAPQAALVEIDVIVVPGIAFDAEGNRLGFGGGYYDALLAEREAAPFTVGIAYEEQVVARVPHEERDQPIDVLVTPDRTIRCATNRP